MLLAIDVGNTHLRLGVARDGVLGAVHRAPTPPAATPDEVDALLGSLLGLDGFVLDGVGALVLSSTVPAATAAVERVAARRAISCLTASAATMPLAVLVDRPADVGPDRLVNAYAAVHLHGAPAVVVDCGTATTLDAVDHDGAFVGGAIAPGLGLGLEEALLAPGLRPLVHGVAQDVRGRPLLARVAKDAEALEMPLLDEGQLRLLAEPLQQGL